MPWRTTGTRPWLIVPLAAALHTTFGLGLLFDYDTQRITAIYLMAQAFGSLAAPLFFTVAFLSMIPMFVPMRAERIHLCLWPQQTILFIAAASALLAASHGYYPDGTEKNGLFIFADQSWTVYLAACHFVATLRNAMIGRHANTVT